MARDLYESAYERLGTAFDQFDRGLLTPGEVIDEAFLILRFAVLSEPDPFDDAPALLETADVGIRARLSSHDAGEVWETLWESALNRLERTVRLHDEAHTRTVEWEAQPESRTIRPASGAVADDMAEVLSHAEPWVGSVQRHLRAGVRAHGPVLLRDVAVRLAAATRDGVDASRRWLPRVLDELAAAAWCSSGNPRAAAARQALLELTAVPGTSDLAWLRLPLHLLSSNDRKCLVSSYPARGERVPDGWLAGGLVAVAARPEPACLSLLDAAAAAMPAHTIAMAKAHETTEEDEIIALVAAAVRARDIEGLRQLLLATAATVVVLPRWAVGALDALAGWAASTHPTLTARERPTAQSVAEAARRSLLTLAGVDSLATVALPRLPLWRLDTRDLWELEALLELRAGLFRESWVDEADIAVTEAVRLTYLRVLAARMGERA